MKNVILIALITISVSICIFIILSIKAHHQDAESDFTPEQKAVLKALRNARAEVDDAHERLERVKAEISMMVDQAKTTVVSKNLDPNVHTDWIAHGVNGTWAIRSNDPKNTPVVLGFRADHRVMWKYADDIP